MKILTIIGARPQFIKAAALSRAIRKRSDIVEVIVHTGQHFDADMSEVFFQEMDIPKPKYNLGVCGKSHGKMTGEMLIGIEDICYSELPDVVLVYGDTNSTLAGALAAAKLNIRVAHIESGLRSRNMSMPEEINRILTDHLSSYIYYPTENAYRNLLKEGFSFREDVVLVNSGDIMQDVYNFYSDEGKFSRDAVEDLIGKDSRYILATIHRAENTSDLVRLKSIVLALNNINKWINVIVPLHPGTKEVINRNKIKIEFDIIQPQSYFRMQSLLNNCSLVITDSGGLQKESFFCKKYCLVIREETEWTELVEYGYNFVVGFRNNYIEQKALELLSMEYPKTINLYGNGNSSEIILDSLMENIY